jgi:hypothetical protein
MAIVFLWNGFVMATTTALMVMMRSIATKLVNFADLTSLLAMIANVFLWTGFVMATTTALTVMTRSIAIQIVAA